MLIFHNFFSFKKAFFSLLDQQEICNRKASNKNVPTFLKGGSPLVLFHSSNLVRNSEYTVIITSMHCFRFCIIISVLKHYCHILCGRAKCRNFNGCFHKRGIAKILLLSRQRCVATFYELRCQYGWKIGQDKQKNASQNRSVRR